MCNSEMWMRRTQRILWTFKNNRFIHGWWNLKMNSYKTITFWTTVGLIQSTCRVNIIRVSFLTAVTKISLSIVEWRKSLSNLKTVLMWRINIVGEVVTWEEEITKAIRIKEMFRIRRLIISNLIKVG